jgi:hypothetical protein
MLTSLNKFINQHNNLVDYFVSYRMKKLEELLQMYQKNGEDFVQKIVDRNDSFWRASQNRTSFEAKINDEQDTIEFQNLALKILDRVPVIDRAYLPISEVVNILPRQLFRNENIWLKISDVIDSLPDEFNSSSILLPGWSKYAYITGILFYENIFDIIEDKYESNSDDELAISKRKQRSMNNKKVFVPKILVLISKKPIYSIMEKWLVTIRKSMEISTHIPIENIIKNLVFECPQLELDYRLNSNIWNIDHKTFIDTKYNFFYQVFKESKEIDNIFQLIVNMISEFSMILVSQSRRKLIAITEVLKTLLFPFEYQGVIIPYEPRPNPKFLLSKESFVIGMNYDTYNKIKDIIEKHGLYIYDLDQKLTISYTNSSRAEWKLANIGQLKNTK